MSGSYCVLSLVLDIFTPTFFRNNLIIKNPVFGAANTNNVAIPPRMSNRSLLYTPKIISLADSINAEKIIGRLNEKKITIVNTDRLTANQAYTLTISEQIFHIDVMGL